MEINIACTLNSSTKHRRVFEWSPLLATSIPTHLYYLQFEQHMSNLAFELQRLQTQIEDQVQIYNNHDKKTQQLQQNRGSLLEQQHQNSSVLKEIELLNEDAKIFKQVGGVLIDQTKKEVKNTLSSRVGLITSQIIHTNQMITAQETEQKAMAEKIQKAKQAYYVMAQRLQANQS